MSFSSQRYFWNFWSLVMSSSYSVACVLQPPSKRARSNDDVRFEVYDDYNEKAAKTVCPMIDHD